MTTGQRSAGGYGSPTLSGAPVNRYFRDSSLNRFASLHELLSIKIGIKPGNPVERGGDLFGMTVQITARLCEHAAQGEILASGVLQRLCEDSTLAARFVDRGRVPLKGVESALPV